MSDQEIRFARYRIDDIEKLRKQDAAARKVESNLILEAMTPDGLLLVTEESEAMSEQFKPGTEVVVTEPHDDLNDYWSKDEGLEGVVVNTIDATFALVFLHKKMFLGKNPMSKVPWNQLEELVTDTATEGPFGPGQAGAYDGVVAVVLESPVLEKESSEDCDAMLADLFAEHEGMRRHVDYALMNVKMYARLAPQPRTRTGSSVMQDGLVSTLWGSTVIVTSKMPDDEIAIVSTGDKDCQLISRWHLTFKVKPACGNDGTKWNRTGCEYDEKGVCKHCGEGIPL